MNQPRVYKNSAASLSLIVLFFIAFLVPVLFGLGSDSVTIILPIIGFVLFIFAVLFLAHSSKVILSDDEITVQNLLGSKTLRWTEVHRVSGRGSGIKLHNFDE
ncbi:MAG: PH domain-containing protein, partial [Anaerolineales bacterium]|nr:PH domain-containing protein [Anaerolineales bacterium]